MEKKIFLCKKVHHGIAFENLFTFIETERRKCYKLFHEKKSLVEHLMVFVDAAEMVGPYFDDCYVWRRLKFCRIRQFMANIVKVGRGTVGH